MPDYKIKMLPPFEKCVTCTKDVVGFRDMLSVKEFNQAGMCQECQDRVFGGGDWKVCGNCGTTYRRESTHVCMPDPDDAA